MSDLTYIERIKLEALFGMSSGYVLDFTDRTFAEFVVESVGRDIYDTKYDYSSGSKANRLRAFWAKEPNHVAGRLTSDLLDYKASRYPKDPTNPKLKECRRIAQRLLQGAPIEDFGVISAGLPGGEFKVVVRAVKDAIDRNELDAGLDRLHTFTVKYIRSLCDKHGIRTDRNKPLHAMFGEYVKKIRGAGLIESDMTERILKSTISTMEAFNQVRNDQSLAHDNPVLNYDESLLILIPS